MKKNIFICIILISFSLSLKSKNLSLGFDKTLLSGKVTDENTGKPLCGVGIYFPELRTGTVTDSAGYYKINDLPKTKIMVQLSLIGYKTEIETVDLSVTTEKNFVLEESILEINQVVITGTNRASELKKSPMSIVSIDKSQIAQNLSTNIINAIAKLPGVNEVSTGPNISKPFIRGLGYNRILTLVDGVRQEGQQWGDEHGVEVDDYTIDHVEVVKGPSSLIYGSDALAGVVNLIPAHPLPIGQYSGNILSEYQSNNRMIGLSGNYDQNKSGMILGTRISHKMTTNYQNKFDGRVYGTSFNESDVSGYIGINKHWGYSHLNFSVFNLLQEIPDGSRDSVTRKFTKQITEADTFRPIVSEQELNSYKIADLHQHVQHYRVYTTNSFFLGDYKLDAVLGWQENIRREFSHPQFIDIPGLYLSLNTYTYDVKFYFPEKKGWEVTEGLNGMYQKNVNNGTEFIIPDYHIFDAGLFIFSKKSIGKVDLSAGFRLDNRFFNNQEMYVKSNPLNGLDVQTNIPDTVGSHLQFQSFKKTFSGVSGSFGMTYDVTKDLLLKFNISQGFRAPNIAEISANGVHPGTNIYQIGNPDFKPELSLQEDLGVSYSTYHVTFNVAVFNNIITNYIYNEKVLNHFGRDSVIINGTETFQFQSAKADLFGGEAEIDIHPHPLDWLHFENSVSIVYGINKGVKGIPISDSARYLPFIPPLHTCSDIRADIKKKLKHFSSLYIMAGIEYYTPQNNVYLVNNTETPTPGYILIDAGFGSDIVNKSGKVLFSVHISANNLANTAYQSHLSRLKYFEPYPNNTTGRSGIYDIGRNISFKFYVPLFKKDYKQRV